MMTATPAPRTVPKPKIAFNLHPRSIVGGVIKTGLNLTTLGLPTGAHMVRYRMYVDIAARMVPYAQRPHDGRPTILGIGRSLTLATTLKIPHAIIIDGDLPEYDLLNLHTVPDESLDYVVSDQVLEHVRGNPQAAADESWRVLKPGGVTVHTTCLLQELHGGVEPSGHLRDYWRFTPNGLGHLFRQFSHVHVSGWGHKLAFAGLRYLPIPHASWHPLHWLAMHSSKDALISTWVIAQK
jgi:SAM-dependent methyltransferase